MISACGMHGGEEKYVHTFLVSKSEGLSVPYTGRLYPPFPGDIPSNLFC